MQKNDSKEFLILDTSNIKLNQDLKIEVLEYGKGKHPIIIVDNFLENPEDLVDIIQKHPFPERTSTCKNHPGWRVLCRLEFLNIKFFISAICDKHYNIGEVFKRRESFYGGSEPNIEFQLNLYQGGTPCLLSTILPHTDSAFVAFNLYLNPNEECLGGTDLYTHIPSGLECDLSYTTQSFRSLKEYSILNSTRQEMWSNNYETIHDDIEIENRNHIWKKEFTLEAKYNRLGIYPAYLFHSVGMKKDWYPNKRYSLAGFIL